VRVIAVFGPTGIGKTAVAIALAELLREHGEDPVAVSADSIQVYDGLPILSGAATPDEQKRLEHRLIGFLPVTATYSAGAYAKQAHETIDELIEQRRRPIVVGGTGLYLRAALADLDLLPPVDPDIRANYEQQLQTHGLEHLFAQLPPNSGIAPTDTQRILRALELRHDGHDLPPAPHAPSQLWTTQTRHPTLLAALTMDRDALYARIEQRIDEMLQNGVKQEVDRAANASKTARVALGFEELRRNDIGAMRTRTRRYAKRQLTWLRKLPNAHRIDVTNRSPEDVANAIHGMI
jgi:tRNA dimethylallyltransferase